jgi:hypothetical protein
VNIVAIRQDLATLGAGAGYANSYAIVPATVAGFPAWIVSVPTDVNYAETLGMALVELLVTVAFSAADATDCQTRLDNALGTTDPSSVFNALNGVAAPTGSWRAIRCVTAKEPRYVKDGQTTVLACDLEVQVWATK